MSKADIGVEQHLAAYAATLCAHAFDPGVYAAFDRLLLDYVSVALAGFSDVECRTAAHVFAKFGGRQESSVIGLTDAVPAPSSAFAQGVCAHWFDWDDTHDESHVHAGAVIFPVAIALAESRANAASPCPPEEWFAAVVAGYDLACGVGGFLKRHAPRGWMPTGSGATIGAAAAGARIKGLSEAEILSAMGIAAANCGLSRQALADKTNAKGTLAGIAAKTATEAVLLAEAGVRGPPNFLTGVYGLQSLHADGHGDPQSIAATFGAPFSITDVSVKPYPCCRSTHAVVDCVLALRRDEPAFAQRVDSIHVRAPAGIFERCGAPFLLRSDPRLDAQFSIAYTAAVALRRGNLSLDDFSVATVIATGAQLSALIGSVTVECDA